MSASNYVSVWVVEILAETEKAFLVLLDTDDDREEWIPFSQCADPDDYSEGDEGVSLSVTEWIAKEKDLPIEEEE